MEIVIALLSGAAGGSLISSLSPKISVSAWISMLGGMAGGAILYVGFMLATKQAFLPAASVDIYSLFAIMSLGFVGGMLAVLPVLLIRLRNLN